MSVLIEAAVWKADHLNTSAKFVALVIAWCATVTGVSYPSVSFISERTGYTERTVRNAVRRLLRADVIRLLSRPGEPDRYQFTAQFLGDRS